MDVDDFKKLNDSTAHAYGNLLLKRLADIFKAKLGEDNHLIRNRGDEFAILYSGIRSIITMRSCAEELKTDPQLSEIQNTLLILISTGVVIVDDFDDFSLNDIYRRSDKVLY
ncbi:MAG: diguanylate cyclase [Kangiellaceae bacterium]|nr:diguanylate cyclase [Kangiellaceae bacterium]